MSDRKRVVFITGEAGQIARGVHAELESSDVLKSVKGEDLESNRRQVSGHHGWPELDILSPRFIGHLNQLRPDIVVHSAAVVNTDKCQSDPARCIDVNTTGTQRVLEACHEIGAKLVYISTTATYDPSLTKRGDRWLKESDAQDPRTIYGITKYAGELIVKHQTRVPWIVIRPCFVFGDPPYDHSSNLCKAAVHSLLKLHHYKAGPRPTFTLDPLNMKDYMRIEDFARAIRSVLELDKWFEVFNVSGMDPHPTREYFQHLQEALHCEIDCDFNGKEDYMNHHLVDSGKLRRMTGWTPKYDNLHAGIPLLAARATEFVLRTKKRKERIHYA